MPSPTYPELLEKIVSMLFLNKWKYVTLTYEQLKETCRVRNKAPGPDGISNISSTDAIERHHGWLFFEVYNECLFLKAPFRLGENTTD